jgi:hypothetical protein
MSQLVKTKRQANFKRFKRFGAFKGLVEQKNVVFNSFMCKLGSFCLSWAFRKVVSLGFYTGPLMTKKNPIYTNEYQFFESITEKIIQGVLEVEAFLLTCDTMRCSKEF